MINILTGLTGFDEFSLVYDGDDVYSSGNSLSEDEDPLLTP